MTAADRLIVALDAPSTDANTEMFLRLYDAGISFFKIGYEHTVAGLFGAGTIDPSLVRRIIDYRADLMLDLKMYGTRDMIETSVKQAFDLGARFVTVHATPSVMEAAMRAKPAGDHCKVLAVGQLTDGGTSLRRQVETAARCHPDGADGMICTVDLVAALKHDYPDLTYICPGVRPANTPADNHMWVATPAVALHRGADYLVVGRPITRSPDPVAAAHAIIEEMENARGQNDGREKL